MVDLSKSVLKRNDLRCPVAPVSLNLNTVLKILCFQSPFSENDQFCFPAKQSPRAAKFLRNYSGIIGIIW
jgi:hypothetical protein